MTGNSNELFIREQLLKNNNTIAIAESVTGGLLQSTFASMENAMHFFQGGITAYNLGQKVKHLLVDPIHAQACNCVSAKVASEMALHVCTLFHSNYGVAITGYDTPVPESGNTVFAFCAIAKDGSVVAVEKLNGDGGTIAVKDFYIHSILVLLEGIMRK